MTVLGRDSIGVSVRKTAGSPRSKSCAVPTEGCQTRNNYSSQIHLKGGVVMGWMEKRKFRPTRSQKKKVSDAGAQCLNVPPKPPVLRRYLKHVGVRTCIRPRHQPPSHRVSRGGIVKQGSHLPVHCNKISCFLHVRIWNRGDGSAGCLGRLDSCPGDQRFWV